MDVGSGELDIFGKPLIYSQNLQVPEPSEDLRREVLYHVPVQEEVLELGEGEEWFVRKLRDVIESNIPATEIHQN